MVRELPRIKVGKKEFFVDSRLNQLRNVKNPNDYIDCSSYEKIEGGPVMVCIAKKNNDNLLNQSMVIEKIDNVWRIRGEDSDTGRKVIVAKKEEIKPKLIAYGTFDVYNISGKAYYLDHIGKKYVRAPERDFMIKEK